MLPPTIPLDDFDLSEVIGRGSAGTVWRARYRHSSGEATSLAVKLLTGAHSRSDAGGAAFRREVRAVAALDHPHIVREFQARWGGVIEALSLARAQWVAQGNAAEVRRIDALLTALGPLAKHDPL
jgi:hypothetical protein